MSKTLLVGASIISMVGAGELAQAAEQGAAALADGSAPIIVTARKHEEVLQNVPLAITALSSKELADASVKSLDDITMLTPGLTYNSAGAETITQLVIRGLSDTSGGEATSQNVSVFLDGVYVQNSAALDLGLGGIERVEVVKGPVSGLYGRNAFTGAVNYVTSNPTNTFHADLALTGGDKGRFIAEGDVSGALVKDLLKVKVAGTYDYLQGTFHDPVSGEYGNGHRKRDVMLTVVFTPASNVTIKPVFYYGHDNFTSPATTIYSQSCAYGTSNSQCGDIAASAIGSFIAKPYASGATGNTRDVTHVHVDAKVDGSWGTFSALLGYNHITTKTINEFSGTENGSAYALYKVGANNPFAGSPTFGTANLTAYFGFGGLEEDKSIEVRYDSPAKKSIRGSIGGYYFDHSGNAHNTFGINGNNIPAGYTINFIAANYVTAGGAPAATLNNANGHTKDYSGFVSADWDIVPTVTLSGALRETSEQIEQDATPSNLQKTFHSLTSNSSITWKPSKQVTVYAAVANGAKSGGFNPAATGPADLTFDPETDWNYELGTKASLMDGHLRLEADVFHTTLSNLQVIGPPATSGAVGLVVKNFGAVHATGVEGDIQYATGTGFKISSGVAYSDPKFASGSYDYNDPASCALVTACASSRLVTVNGKNAVSLAGLRPPFSSQLTFNASAEFRRKLAALSDIEFYLRGDYRHESSQFTTVTNFAYFGARNVVNLHVGLDKGPWDLSFHALNLTNDLTPTNVAFNASFSGFDAPPVGAYGIYWQPIASLPLGRTFSARIAFHY